MVMIPDVFERIKLNTFAESACSPAVAQDFRGLHVGSPSKIFLADGTPFPIAGTYQVGAAFFNRFRSLRSEIVVVAVDARAHVPHACNLRRPGATPEPAVPFDTSDPGFDGIVVTGWFNLDLFRWMPDLPRGPGRYHVFSTVGDVVSNTVTVELAEP
jgi:hypothetical protein